MIEPEDNRAGRREPVAVSRTPGFLPLFAKTFRAWRLPFSGLAIAGLAVGAAVAFSTPQHYTSHARVLIDPRAVASGGDAGAPVHIDNGTALAIVDSQLDIVRSTAVLNRVVERAKLDRDPDFNGEGGGNALLRLLHVYTALFSSGDTLSERDRAALGTLRENLSVEREAGTFVIDIGITARNPETSALVANAAARAFIEERERLKPDVAASARDMSGTAARLVSPAPVPDTPSSPSRAIVIAGFAAAGLALGVLLACFSVIREAASGAGRGAARFDDHDDLVAAAIRMAMTESEADPPLSAEPIPRDSGEFRPVHAAGEDEELEDLRRSVRELRESVELLMRRRAERRQRLAQRHFSRPAENWSKSVMTGRV
jgi:capsular polysaccharide biosynthesis protein